MAKGRKLTTSRSELYLGSFSYDHGHGAAANGSSELREDEVWSMVDDDTAFNEVTYSASSEWSTRASAESNGSLSGSYKSRRPINPLTDHHHHRRQVGGLSLAFDNSSSNASSPRIVHQFRPPDSMAESPRARHVASSAPVNVPDWSKIYRVNSVESMQDSDDGLYDDSEVVPPHEYLAREYARSRKMVANSVFEGVGRKLKGRDLSRVRDTVWSQTGFDG
ncbi:hypothetical protein ABFS83_08G148400 [Erythranthe nasuta]